MHISKTDFPCAHGLHPRKPIVRVYYSDTAKYTGPRTFTEKKTLGPVKPVSFIVLLSEEDYSILLPFSLIRPVKLQ